MLSFVKSTFAAILLVFITTSCHALSKNGKTSSDSLKISEAEFNKVLQMHEGDRIKSTDRVLNNAVVVKNVKTGDMQYCKIQLASIPTGYLIVQVNGTYTRQVFITTENKSAFYKNSTQKGDVQLVRCQEDDIVSE